MVSVVCVQSYRKDSPSSGLFRVKVYNEYGMAQRNGTGMLPREVVQKPLSDSRLGVPAGLPASVSEGVDAAEPRVGPSAVDG